MLLQTSSLLFSLFAFTSNLGWSAVDTPKPVEPKKVEISKQLTNFGQSRHPVVVSDNKILYVSRNRKQHKDPQIYMLDMTTGKETRVTYQRGHIVNGLWLANGEKIIYASSTDEEKETPQLLKKFLDRFPAEIDTQFFFHLSFKPTEIYMSDLLGRKIDRISTYSGFDAFPAYIEKTNELFFSRLGNDRIGLYKQSLDDHKKPWKKRRKKRRGQKNKTATKATKVLQTLGHDLGLQVSPSQDRFVWFRFSPDFGSSQLMISDNKLKNPTFLTMDEGIQWAPSWHPNEKSIIYSAKKGKDRNYELYEVATKGNCQRKLASLAGDEFFPVISPDGQQIYFTSTKSGTEQIHKMKYPSPLNCEPL